MSLIPLPDESRTIRQPFNSKKCETQGKEEAYSRAGDQPPSRYHKMPDMKSMYSYSKALCLVVD